MTETLKWLRRSCDVLVAAAVLWLALVESMVPYAGLLLVIYVSTRISGPKAREFFAEREMPTADRLGVFTRRWLARFRGKSGGRGH